MNTITSRNSKVLRTDIAYNLVNHDYLINDAVTLLKLAIKDLEFHVDMGIASEEMKAKLQCLKTAINYATV